jgi:hypothetical protein
MRLNVDTRMQREPARLGGTAVIPLLFGFIGRQRLQREQLLPGTRTCGNAIRDGMANQVIQRPGFCVRGQPGALDVALDQATLLQQTPVPSRVAAPTLRCDWRACAAGCCSSWSGTRRPRSCTA